MLEKPNWLSNLKSVSMDGPNVNWALLDILKREIIHSLRSKQSSNFGIGFLWFALTSRSIRHSSEGKKLEYDVEMTQYDLSDHMFPLRFCGHCWLENSDIISRIIAIFPNLEDFIEKAPKSATSLESFKIIKK